MTRVTFVGHSTVLVETAGIRLLTDPLLRSRIAHLRRTVAFPAIAGLTEPRAVLLSHAHLDHLDLPSLRRLAPSARVILPRGWGSLARRAGLADVTEMEQGDRVAVDAAEVVATPAEHDGHRFPLGRNSRPLGYVIDGGRRVYFAGDTDLFEGMRDLAGDLDVALLPVAGWGRRLPPGHLNPERAAHAAALLRPRYAVPIHWGTYVGPGVRLHDLARPAIEFEQFARSHAPGVEVRVLHPGDSLVLED